MSNKIVHRSHAASFFIIASFYSTNVFSAAGDLISNTVSISYDIGGTPGTINASTSFTEDRRINFLVTESNGGAAVPVISDMAAAVLQFTITNSGNDAHDFLVTAVNTAPNPFGLPVDSFDPLPGSVQVFVESGLTPGYQVAQDTTVFIDELAVNASSLVYVVADMPTVVADDVSAIALITQIAEGGTTGVEGIAINADDNSRISPAGIYSNGSTNVVAGSASNNPDTLAMETVFNDPGSTNPEDVSTDLNQDILGNGQHSDTGVFQVTSPVNLTKSMVVIDTLGGNDPHPGSTIRYQIDVNVVGNSDIDNLLISDLIPANTTYTDGSIVLNGTIQTDASDAPTDFSRAIDILSKPVLSIEVDLSQGGAVPVVPGSTNTIIFEVTIN
jgi:uncharacterized repeat protein (TIGR01451 family)